MGRPKTDRSNEVLQRLLAHHALHIHPSPAKLARDMGCSPGTVRTALKELVAEGIIVRLTSGRDGTRANQYEVIDHD